MATLIEPLEYLAREGIRINFGKNVSSILVGKGEINESYMYIGPGEENGVIGVCYVPENDRESNLLNINSSGHGLTQIAFNDRLYTICHAKKDLRIFLNNSFVEVSGVDYIRRLEEELDFLF